jgi:excisionase family DNA binding protein
MSSSPNADLLDVNGAAEFLSLKQSRIRAAVFRREIPYLKIGGLVRFRRSDLERWIESRLVSPAAGRSPWN